MNTLSFKMVFNSVQNFEAASVEAVFFFFRNAKLSYIIRIFKLRHYYLLNLHSASFFKQFTLSKAGVTLFRQGIQRIEKKD